MPTLPSTSVQLLLQHYARAAQESPALRERVRHSWLAMPDGTLPPTLGLANRTAHLLLAGIGSAEARRSRGEWRAAGLFSLSGREALTGCLVVPLVPVARVRPSLAALPLRALLDPRGIQVRCLGSGWTRLPNHTPRRATLFACSDPFDALVLRAAGVAAVALHMDGPTVTSSWSGLVAHLRALSPRRLCLICAATARGLRVSDLWREVAAAAALDVDARQLPTGCSVRDVAHLEGAAAIATLVGLAPERLRQHPMRRVPALEARPESIWPWRDDRSGVGPALRDYLTHLRSAGRRADECGRTARQLAPFWVWCTSRKVTSMAVLRRRHLEAYQANAGDASDSASTRARRVAALRSFLRWAFATGRTRHDLAGVLASVRRPVTVPPRVLSEREIERTLAAVPVRRPAGLRDRTMLELLYATGIRRGELAGIDVADVQASVGVLRVRRGKGGTARLVPLSPRAAAWLQRYLDDVRPRHLRDLREPALFVSRRGRRLTPKEITGRMHACWAAAGLPQAGSCHVVRHSVATLMHDRGADIRDLQALLGHAVLTSTQLYTRVSMQRLQEVHRRTHPGGDGGYPPEG